MREAAAEAGCLANARGIVSLFENNAIDVWNVLNDFRIALHVKLSVKTGREIQNIFAFNRVARARGAPGLFDSCGGGEMTSTGGDSCNENAHGSSMPISCAGD